MDKRRLILAIVGVLAGALAILPNLIKSQAQSQTSDPPPLPQTSTPAVPIQIPNYLPLSESMNGLKIIQMSLYPLASLLVGVFLTHRLCN